MPVDDSSVLLRRQLRDCRQALQRHRAAIAAFELAAAPLEAASDPVVSRQPNLQRKSTSWLVAAGEPAAADGSSTNPNPPRLWFDLCSFGASGDGVTDDSAALSAALHAATVGCRGGATIRIPAGTYRLCPPLHTHEEHAPLCARATSGVGSGGVFTRGSVAPGVALPCGVHLVGEGPARTRLEVVTAHSLPGGDGANQAYTGKQHYCWQLLATAGGGTHPLHRWRRSQWAGGTDAEQIFPIALATDGLVLVELTLAHSTCDFDGDTHDGNTESRRASCGERLLEQEPTLKLQAHIDTTEGVTPTSNFATAEAVRQQRLVTLLRSVHTEPTAAPLAARRYDVRLQECVLEGKYALNSFDSPSLHLAHGCNYLTKHNSSLPGAGISTATAPVGVSSNTGVSAVVRRGCAVCEHTARGRKAQELLTTYQCWSDGVQLFRSGHYCMCGHTVDGQGAKPMDAQELVAAEVFRCGAMAASIAEHHFEAAVLWSNAAECFLRCPGRDCGCVGLAEVAVQRALELWPEHADSQARLRCCQYRNSLQANAAMASVGVGTDDDVYRADSSRKQEAEPKCQLGCEHTLTTLGCRDVDSQFFGSERTGGTALTQLAGELHGTSTELEAALALLTAHAYSTTNSEDGYAAAQALSVSARSLWRHADQRTPRERALSWGAVALNVAVPNSGGSSCGSDEEDADDQASAMSAANKNRAKKRSERQQGGSVAAVYQELDFIYSDEAIAHLGQATDSTRNGNGDGNLDVVDGGGQMVWCEVKAWETLVTEEEAASEEYSGSERVLSSAASGGSVLARWSSLLAQLERYRQASLLWAAQRALPEPPAVAAVISGVASARAVTELRARGFGCISLGGSSGGSDDNVTRPGRTGSSIDRSSGYTAPAEARDVHAIMKLSGKDIARISREMACLPPLRRRRPESSPLAAAATVAAVSNTGFTSSRCTQGHGNPLILNVDQGMLALLVSNIWALSTYDMEQAGCTFFRLYSGDTVFTTPDGLLETLRPLYSLLTAPHAHLVCSATSAAEFEKFLALRGDDLEKARWGALLYHSRDSGKHKSASLASSLVPDAHAQWLAAEAKAESESSYSDTREEAVGGAATSTQETEQRQAPRRQVWRLQRITIMADVALPPVLAGLVVPKVIPAVALGMHLGVTTLIDDITTMRRLRYHPAPNLRLLLTPEGKLRASYLGLSVKGRPELLLCTGGVCCRSRPSSEFSYTFRRAAARQQQSDSPDVLLWKASLSRGDGGGTGANARATHGDGIAAACPEERPIEEEEEEEEKVTCSACVAASSAVSLVVEGVFRVPAIWAQLVVKARARWLVTERPWCQRRWILAQLLRCAASMSALERDSEGIGGSASKCAWEWEEVILPLALNGSNNRRGSVGARQQQMGHADQRARELFTQMAQWLADAVVWPRPPALPVAQEKEEGEEDGGMLLGFGAVDDDY